MPAVETVALVTGIIGCAASLLTIAPRFREPLQKCYRNLMEQIPYMQEKISYMQEKISYMQYTKSKLSELYEVANLAVIVDPYIAYEIMDFCSYIEQEDFDCLFGYLPNYFRLYEIAKKIDEINVTLLEFGFQLKPRRTGESLVYFFFGPAGGPEILRIHWLISHHNIIGVSGAIGIGKTKVVAHFCQQIGKVDSLIWVEASYEDDVKMLQMKLARKMGLSLSSNVTVNAVLLRKSLTKRRFLVVLDNLWKAFSLEEIGIPIERHGPKIILISRSSSVCSQMRSEKIIELKLLSDEVAYQLLSIEVAVRAVRKLSSETLCILQNLAAECGGLPLAIDMVAGHLTKLNWNDETTIETALKNQLDAFKESPGDVKYIDNNVFENFVLHYEQLKNSNYSCTQECFLWCTIYPRNTTFVAKELMEYWMWEGLLGEVERIDKKLREAQEILDELKDACFLHGISHEKGVEIVKLHPLIWDMAIQMIKESPKFFIKAGRRLRKPLYKDWPENVERVSLMSNDIKELRSGSNFWQLSTLLLQRNPIDLPIDNAFFNSIPNLKILNLSNTGVRILPESLSCLKNLIALLLQNCWALISLPTLSELLALTVLDISGSPIAQLPCDMSSELLRLDLSRTRVRNFPLSLLIKHYNLQELLMIGCDLTWISRSLMQDDNAACIEDVEKLEYLSVLEITFSTLQTFCDYISSEHWSQLKSFKFCVGGLYNGKLGNNSLAFIKQYPSDSILLPDNTLELLVMHCGDVTLLTISRFWHLKIVDISYCANLKSLFKLEDLKHLQNLEQLVIAHCLAMEKVTEQDKEDVMEQDEEEVTEQHEDEIIEQDDEEVIEQDEGNPSVTTETITLPKLQKLTLFNLPQLRFFSHRRIKCDSLQTIAVWNCNKLRSFPVVLELNDFSMELETPQGLKEVIGESSWFQGLKNPSDVLAPLHMLFVEKPPPEELISRGRMMDSSDS